MDLIGFLIPVYACFAISLGTITYLMYTAYHFIFTDIVIDLLYKNNFQKISNEFREIINITGKFSVNFVLTLLTMAR
ncbi:MAG: hypothetical protein Ta2B_00740 [Termitinemataceae bacterium]|nr:MAG: hypothetical protein Ta2B_00740 [Termitinemataceae bacterium]